MSKVLVTIPAHNEEKFLYRGVYEVRNLCSRSLSDFELLVAEDGSKDGTPRILEEIGRSFEKVSIISRSEKMGRGGAISEAWLTNEADVYVFVDADLAPDINQIPRFVELINGGYDLVTGSRYLPGSRVKRPILRYIASRYYNLMIRLLFRDGIYDHQCGLKAFSSHLIRSILRQCSSRDWFWDTEILVLARKNGLRIMEVPIRWIEPRGKYTPVKRLIKDSIIHGMGIAKLFYRIHLARGLAIRDARS